MYECVGFDIWNVGINVAVSLPHEYQAVQSYLYTYLVTIAPDSHCSLGDNIVRVNFNSSLQSQ